MTTEAPRRHPIRVLIAAVVGAFICGAGVASQSRINGQLASELDDAYVAAFFSFGSGMLILLVAIAVAPTGRRGLSTVIGEVRAGRMPWWYLLGGTSGAFFVLTQGLTAAVLGIAVFTVAIVAGQTIAGFIIDRRGLGTMQPRPITVARAVGGILMLLAVGVVVSGQVRESFPWWVVVMPLVAGFFTGWQQAVNGQVRVASDSPIAATFINFVVGTVVLLVAALVHVASAGLPTSLPANPVLYLGGVIGMVFIALGTIVTPMIGVLLMGFGLVAGQLTTSLVLDLLVPVAEHPISWVTVAGTALALVAVSIAAIPRRVRVPSDTVRS